MSTSTRQRAKRAIVNHIVFPPNYPDPRRPQGSGFFRAAAGNLAPSTFAKYRAEGLIPPPDMKVGNVNQWFEPTIDATVKALAARSAFIAALPAGAQ